MYVFNVRRETERYMYFQIKGKDSTPSREPNKWLKEKIKRCGCWFLINQRTEVNRLKMKIAYIIEVNPYLNSGIVKKIKDQTAFWKQQGHDVKTHIIWPYHKNEKKHLQGEVFSDMFVNALPNGFVKTYLTKITGISRVSRQLTSFNPDIVYIRQNIWYPGLTSVLSKYRTILEINSVDFMEMKFYSSLKRRVYMFGKNRILNVAKGIIAVSPDILQHYTSLKIPSTVVSNGINLSSFITRKNAEVESNVNLVFVGSKNMEWHGLDRVLDLAKEFEQYNFIVVGYDKKGFLADTPRNVTFCGWVDENELQRIYEKCHFGIGSFGNFLVGKNVDSTLKVREYLAYGLPVILGHHDVDFIESEFVLKITKEDNTFIDREEISEFIERYRKHVVPKGKLRIIDSVTKEQERLSFFTKICEANP